MKIGVIGDTETAIGFRLAGLSDVYEAKTKDEVINALNELDREDIAFVIITEKLALEVKDFLEKYKKVVVQIPDKSGKVVKEDPIKELIRKAVGVVK
ncbi:V-type ATP synthase subunit F [Methanocaldococcus indicus]|uniref:V-type ATP synthase subunit F n=1 Tax=Methanocaldococcus indicus TaxID=213231 RepID=UPI003C6D0603